MADLKLDPTLKAEWTAALRSGKYEQGQAFLNKDNRFCCLGVLCEVMHLPKITRGNVVSYEGIGGERAHIMPMVKGNINDVLLQKLTANGKHGDLMYHNDAVQTPFTVIADAIDEQL